MHFIKLIDLIEFVVIYFSFTGDIIYENNSTKLSMNILLTLITSGINKIMLCTF